MTDTDDGPPAQASAENTGASEARNLRLPAIIEAAALLVFLAAATTFAVTTPPMGAPDEEGHTVYADALSHGMMPTPAAEMLRRHPDGTSIYRSAQAHHPPLFYALVAGIDVLTGRQPGALTPIGRILSIISGLGALLLIRAAMHRAFPDRPIAIAAGLALAVASASFTYIMGSFNNEPLAVLLVCASIYLAVRALQSPRPTRWLAGVGAALGVGLLVKLTAAVIVVPLLAAAVGVTRREGEAACRAKAIRGAVGAFAIAAVISGPWFIRNYILFGTPTFNCAHRPIADPAAAALRDPAGTLVAAGLTVEELLAGAWWPGWLVRDHQTLLADLLLHGYPGPEARPVWLVILPLAVAITALVGVARLFRSAGAAELRGLQRPVLWLLVLLPVMAALGIFHQVLLVDGHIIRWAGRYLPVAIPALGMVLALGLWKLLPERGRPVLPVVALVFAVAMNAWAIYRVLYFYAHAS